MLVGSYLIVPQVNDQRSGRAFIESALAQLPPGAELGLLAYKEQFLLYLDRPVVNFGHARYAEDQSHAQESHDAAHWLNAGDRRFVLLPQPLIQPCFANSAQTIAGETSRETWLLVAAPASPACASAGDPKRAIRYSPPARLASPPR
jgi:hypothetical protein